LPADERDSAGASEIEEFARACGYDYAAVTRRAARGDAKALKPFFTIAEDVDGAAAEMHSNVLTAIYHILGDQKFATFLRAQPLTYRIMVICLGRPHPWRPKHYAIRTTRV
jgi:hypothetical protein